jgi:hypothetical protein
MPSGITRFEAIITDWHRAGVLFLLLPAGWLFSYCHKYFRPICLERKTTYTNRTKVGTINKEVVLMILIEHGVWLEYS